jgi:ribosomal protein S18 acetylase RimI-like enzyme
VRSRREDISVTDQPTDKAYEIVPLTLDDLDEACSLWESIGLWLRPSDSREQMELFLGRDPGLHLAARDASGRLIATVLGGWDGRRGYVYHLAVASERQREGIAGRLMDELEERFRARGVLKAKLQITVENEVSRAFFAQRGYELESDCEPWGKELVPGGAPPASRDPGAPEGLRRRMTGDEGEGAGLARV